MVAGKMCYINDSSLISENVIAETGLNLPNKKIDGKVCREIYQTSLQIYQDSEVMQVLSLYSFLGILYRCFRSAGYPPHFLLFINGRTGSMKTTIAKILYTQLCNNLYRENPRRLDIDSVTSFERGIVESGYDTILLFDDYAPAKTPQKAREMKGNLEAIIRMVGDGSTKSRSNAKLEDVRGEGVQGMVVVTGELKGKGASSNLRCLYLEMKREVANIEVISFFQECAVAYTSLLNCFASYIGEKWDGIIHLIEKEFPQKRKKISQSLHERRTIDTAATLQITADIVCGFLTEYCQFPDEEVNNLHNEMLHSAVAVTAQSEETSHDEAFSVTFLKALHELMQTGKINLHNGKPESMVELENYDGYFDEISYYFYLPAFYKKILGYFRETNRYFSLEPDEIATELCQDKLSESGANGVSSSGRARRNKYWRVKIKGENTKINFVKIRKNIFEDVINGLDIETLEK